MASIVDPSGYYTSKYSGEEIDRMLGGGVSNQNLLDNWYFADPINQRGMTTITSNAGISEYFIDRWKCIASGGGQFFLSDGQLAIIAPASSGATLTQPFELLPAGTYTLSVLMANGELFFGTLYWDGAATVYTNWLSGALTQPFRLTLQVLSGAAAFRIHAFAGSTIALFAAKLELGSVQTLARQDADGSWILNDPPPNKALELLKCQRYQNVIAGNNVMEFSGYTTSSGLMQLMNIPLAVPFVKTPAVIYDGATFTIRGVNGYAPFATHNAPSAPTGSMVYYSDRNMIKVGNFFGENTMSPNNTPIVTSLRAGKIILDANL